jgi:hypothetical protein
MPAQSPPVTNVLNTFGSGKGITIQKAGQLQAKRIPKGFYTVQPNEDGTVSASSIFGLGNFILFNEKFAEWSDGLTLDVNDDPTVFASQDAFVAWLEANIY